MRVSMYSRYVISQVKHNGYFLVGLLAGLYLALVVVPLKRDAAVCAPSGPAHAAGLHVGGGPEPHAGGGPGLHAGGGPRPARALQRPRYYSTELGMREPLFAAVLSSEGALETRAAALNVSAAAILPALKFFVTASPSGSSHARHSNVVAFTDTREMLKPFHVLKYLADNYLEEYDYFFLVGDEVFLNARRLLELVRRISVSRDVYMGVPAEEDSHYCSLDRGILLSNSVLRRVHGALDWCVRNSYSAQHHENLGRCVLHSAQLKCTQSLQGQQYVSLSADQWGVLGGEPGGELGGERGADAVTAHPVPDPRALHALHAHVSRVTLERVRDEIRSLRRDLWLTLPRHPEGFRNGTWPGGLRGDAGLAPPLPETRFDHLRWTWFNETHAHMLDEHSAVSVLPRAHREAVRLVLKEARAWAGARWSEPGDLELVEGYWRWEPARALRYRLLVRAGDGLRLLEACRPLGAARLVPVPYVTESARVSVVLPLLVHAHDAPDHLAFLQRYESVCLRRDRKTDLTVVLVYSEGAAGGNGTEGARVRGAVAALGEKFRGASVGVLTYPETVGERGGRWRGRAVRWAVGRLPREALVLVAVHDMEFNEDFLNRVRMNTIAGRQWYSPVPFARFSQYDHPMFRDPDGAKPQVDTGRFDRRDVRVLSFYRRDLEAAGGDPCPARALAAAPGLHCVRAPEPGLVLRPPRAPCPSAPGPARSTCLRDLERSDFAGLNLGNRHALAKMMLEMGLL